jgi:hypothetical protein
VSLFGLLQTVLARAGLPLVFAALRVATALFLCGLTFELSRAQRQDALARTEKMYRVPQAGPRWPAVGPRLERGVRPQRSYSRALRHDST